LTCKPSDKIKATRKQHYCGDIYSVQQKSIPYTFLPHPAGSGKWKSFQGKQQGLAETLTNESVNQG